MPTVSVIIPCYNLGPYLDEAVDSVLSQTYEDYEIVIIDDGSTDPETVARVRAQEHKGCKVFLTENQGLPKTRNFGISNASGRFICCLDADDKYHPRFLQECVKALDADSELGFVTTRVKVFGQSQAYWPCSDYDPGKLTVENVVHVASLFRRSCWEEVGGYATNLTGFQDWNFWISIVARGYRWALVKRPLFLYRDREGSMIKGSELKRRDLKKTIVENNIQFFRDHVAEAMDAYEGAFLEMREASQAREVAVAKTALEKLVELRKEHAKLKARHEALLKAFHDQ